MRIIFKPIPEKNKIQNLAKSLNINEILAKILVQRNITNFEEAKQFFRPTFENLHDPFLMKDMQKAVERIQKAFKNKEKILIYGDYDVDGTSAVCLIKEYLDSLQADTICYIPDRYKEGYGISYAGIDFAKKNKITLLIALDCGIKAVEKITYAREKNIDCIICDHHKPGEKLPPAFAILNPKQKNCKYPYKELCGCGVGFKLVQALQKAQNKNFKEIKCLLDLVAVATASDIVPMDGENRILTALGLERMNKKPRIGLKILKKTLQNEKANVRDIVFGIAPKINAAARMKHGLEATKILLAKDENKAKKMALVIEEYNKQRKKLEEKITNQALSQIQKEGNENACSTVVWSENWHKGVIGIVASRLIETYYRPTVVFTKNENILVGSVRSVRGFDIYECLEKCKKYIQQFGGHKYAAGLSILPEDYENFKKLFEKNISETMPLELKTPEIRVDSEINLKDLDAKFCSILDQMAPFGPSNMRPVFLCENLKDTGFAKKMGAKQEHLKLFLYQEGNVEKQISAVGFGLGNQKNVTASQKKFTAIFCLGKNTWQGKTNLQLDLKAIY